MAAPLDPHPLLQNYAHPENIVTSQWLGARLGSPEVKVVESDEDRLLYDIGHLPTAVRIDWRRDLTDPVTRTIIGPEAFAALMREKGIERNDTVVIYGDKSNWWATFTFWVFTLYGHPDVRILNGGRDAWMKAERETSFMVPTPAPSNYPVPDVDWSNAIFVSELRALVDDGEVGSLGSTQVLDTRSPEEFAGEPVFENQSSLDDDDDFDSSAVVHAASADDFDALNPSAPHSEGSENNLVGSICTGHIPGAVNIPWDGAVYPNGTFRRVEELKERYGDSCPADQVITYCMFGERSAHTWFVLKYLLGWENVRSYYGSWVEWGNMVGMPVEKGAHE